MAPTNEQRCSWEASEAENSSDRAKVQIHQKAKKYTSRKHRKRSREAFFQHAEHKGFYQSLKTNRTKLSGQEAPEKVIIRQGLHPHPGPVDTFYTSLTDQFITSIAAPKRSFEGLNRNDDHQDFILETINVTSLAKHEDTVMRRRSHCIAITEHAVPMRRHEEFQRSFKKNKWDLQITDCDPDAHRPTGGTGVATWGNTVAIRIKARAYFRDNPEEAAGGCLEEQNLGERPAPGLKIVEEGLHPHPGPRGQHREKKKRGHKCPKTSRKEGHKRMGKGACVILRCKVSGYIAQWLERLTADQQVPGSNPGVP